MGFSRSSDMGLARGADPNRCVWMSAGILSYQLCERDMDCDRCPLDAALRHHFARPGAPADPPAAGAAERVSDPAAGAPRRPAPRDGELPGDRHYGRRHTWFQLRPGRAGASARGRIGLEPRLAALLMDPREVVLPGVGERVTAGGALTWLVTDGGTLAIPAPAAGLIVAANSRLARQPHLLTQDPLGEGWILDLESSDEEIREAGLLTASDAGAAWQVDRGAFEEGLAAALRSPAAAVGVTLADGGRPLQRLSDMLGADRYYALVRRAFLRA